MARRDHAASCAPAISHFLEILRREYLKNQPAEISEFVSGEHPARGGGTSGP